MIEERNLSSLSSQTAKPCPWLCKLSKQGSIRPYKYFDYYPPIIKAVRLRTTRSLLDPFRVLLWLTAFGWVKVHAWTDRWVICHLTPCVHILLYLLLLYLLHLLYLLCKLEFCPGISPTVFTAFTLGTHIAAAVRGDRASGQFNNVSDMAKVFPPDQRNQRMSLSWRPVSGTHKSLGARLKDFWTGSRPELWPDGAIQDSAWDWRKERWGIRTPPEMSWTRPVEETFNTSSRLCACACVCVWC